MAKKKQAKTKRRKPTMAELADKHTLYQGSVQVPEAEYFLGYRDGYDEWDRMIGSMQRKR